MGGWYNTLKFENLINSTKVSTTSCSSLLKSEHYLSALDQVYESREAFMKSAESVAKFVVLQYTVVLGFVYVLCSGKEGVIIDDKAFFIASLFAIIFAGANYFVFMKKYEDKLIAGYDIYMSAVIQAAIMYQKIFSNPGSVVVPMHSWLNLISRNDAYLNKLDSTNSGLLCLRVDKEVDKAIQKYSTVALSRAQKISLPIGQPKRLSPGDVGTHEVHLAIARFVEGNIFNFYKEMLYIFCLKIPVLIFLLIGAWFSWLQYLGSFYLISKTWFSSFALTLSIAVYVILLQSER